MGSQENSKIEENSGLQEADKQDSIARMKELISFLNEAAKAYYQEGREIVWKRIVAWYFPEAPAKM